MTAIPVPIVVACVGLIAVFAILAIRMLLEAAAAIRALRSFADAMAHTSTLSVRHGGDPNVIAAIRARCVQAREPVKVWWSWVDDNLERYTHVDGRDAWYLAVAPREILRSEALVERFYQSSLYQSVPGVLTALGLLATFIAILLALTSLHVTVANNTETVTGIKELIEGLAGKFVSSIVGLLLSIVFLMMERTWCERRLLVAYEGLLERVSRVLPTLSPTRILLDAQRLTEAQSRSLSAIHAEVAGLREAVSVANATVPEMAIGLASEVDQFSDRLSELSARMSKTLQRLS